MKNEVLKEDKEHYQSPKWLETSTMITDSSILAILASVEIALFIKLKFKMDFSGKLTLLLLLLASAIRFVADF